MEYVTTNDFSQPVYEHNESYYADLTPEAAEPTLYLLSGNQYEGEPLKRVSHDGMTFHPNRVRQ